MLLAKLGFVEDAKAMLVGMLPISKIKQVTALSEVTAIKLVQEQARKQALSLRFGRLRPPFFTVCMQRDTNSFHLSCPLPSSVENDLGFRN